ncbi:hypothetical protein HYX70_00970 [Candidatus Saccharibacteria bacterium]|nr:hypothetical protein [Candidatus Saccharibacteria bacterium]
MKKFLNTLIVSLIPAGAIAIGVAAKRVEEARSVDLDEDDLLDLVLLTVTSVVATFALFGVKKLLDRL